jgi:hypothetical protein
MGNRQSKGGAGNGAGAGAQSQAAGAEATPAAAASLQPPADRSQMGTTPLSGGKGSRGTATKWHVGPGGEAEK